MIDVTSAGALPWCRRSSRTSTSSVGCRPSRRSIALRWVQFNTGLITFGAWYLEARTRSLETSCANTTRPFSAPAHDRASSTSRPRLGTDGSLARLWRFGLSVLEIKCRLCLPRVLHAHLLPFPKAVPCSGPSLPPHPRASSRGRHATTTSAVRDGCIRGTRPCADHGSCSPGARPVRRGGYGHESHAGTGVCRPHKGNIRREADEEAHLG